PAAGRCRGGWPGSLPPLPAAAPGGHRTAGRTTTRRPAPGPAHRSSTPPSRTRWWWRLRSRRGSPPARRRRSSARRPPPGPPPPARLLPLRAWCSPVLPRSCPGAPRRAPRAPPSCSACCAPARQSRSQVRLDVVLERPVQLGGHVREHVLRRAATEHQLLNAVGDDLVPARGEHPHPVL